MIQVVVANPSGDTLAVSHIPFSGERIPNSVADSTIAARVARFRNAELEAAFRQAVRIPPVYPPVEGIVVGNDGVVWLRLRATDRVRPHLVLSSTGEVIGTANLPLGAEVMAVSQSRVWAVVTDELGVESVVRYRIGS